MSRMKLVMTKEQIGNLLVFLDRVEYKGFKEVAAIQDLVSILQNPESEPEAKPKKID